jgi:hypothetical protein
MFCWVTASLTWLAVAILVLWDSMRPPRKPKVKAISPQRKADDNSNGAEWYIVAVSKVNPTPDTTKKTDHTEREIKHWWALILRWPWKRTLEILGLIAGIAYAVVTIVQWQDLRHNFEADERSWEKIGILWPPQPVGISGVQVSIINFGKSVIDWSHVEARLEIIDKDKSPSLDLNQIHTFNDAAPIFPTEPVSFDIVFFDHQTGSSRAFTDAENKGLLAGQYYVAVFGAVQYHDQFGLHWYKFCNWRPYAAIHASFSAGQCVAWNSVGDGILSMP